MTITSTANQTGSNFRRVHESLNNLTPAEVYHGKAKEITTAGNFIEEQTIRHRRRMNMGL